jgi:uncharacterized protein (DUF1800 family)
MKQAFLTLLVFVSALTVTAQTGPTLITNINTSGNQRNLRFPQGPAIKAYTILSSTNLNQPFATNNSFSVAPYGPVNSVVGPVDIIIDNLFATTSGSWSTGTSATDKYGSDYRFRSSSNGTASVTFRPTLPVAGDYDVYVWYTQGTNRTIAAPHIVTHTGGSTGVPVNQQVFGGLWNFLGRFNFASGTNGFVRVMSSYPDAEQVVVADAVRFVGNGAPHQTNQVLDAHGYEWRSIDPAPQNFYQLAVTPLTSNEVVTATVLNRLAYGQTPYDLDRLASIGPQAYIDEQLAPEFIAEDVENQHANLPIIQAKFAAQNVPVTTDHATISDFRAWHLLRAVGARRQLVEILLQFFENHFVTQFSKSDQYFDRFYDVGAIENRLAAQWEYLEHEKWRTVLLSSTGTFYDMLKVSAESPAMIVYLDTVDSRGDGGRIANENYARELLELFTFGVDNGYDQNDIVEISKCWTGWRAEIVEATNAFNPFASQSTTAIPPLTWTNNMARSNLLGCWVLNYQQNRHNNNAKVVFTNRFVPARFGPPYTTKTYGTNTIAGLYQLYIPPRTGTNGMRDGDDVVRHLADLPFTQEYMCVKLCQLFVHDNFHTGYDFTDPNLSPEGQLVKQCMAAWENGNPKGQLRQVLAAIFNSALFRSHDAAFQKVKTPLEFVVSAIRALRISTNSFTAASFTSDTDGYALGGTSSTSGTIPLVRMGGMFLFDRGDPDGYPEAAPGWISAGTIAERIRFVQSFCISSGQPGHSGSQSGTGNDAGSATAVNPVELLRWRLPAQSLTNAPAVADCILGLLYPGEGAGNLALYRQTAIDFLNDGSADGAVSTMNKLFHELPVLSGSGDAYDKRVRGMTAMLMAMQRFQEQ